MKEILTIFKYIALVSIVYSSVLIADYLLPTKQTEEIVVGSKTTAHRRSGGATRYIETNHSKFVSSYNTLRCCVYIDDTIRLEKTILFNVVKSYFLRNEGYNEEYTPDQSIYSFLVVYIALFVTSILFLSVKNEEARLRLGALMLIALAPNFIIWFVL